MGADFYAKIILTFPCSIDNLYEREEVRLCSHSIPEGSKFCPECGRPRSKTRMTKARPGWEDCVNEDEAYYNDDAGMAICELAKTDQYDSMTTIVLADIQAHAEGIKRRLVAAGIKAAREAKVCLQLYCSV